MSMEKDYYQRKIKLFKEEEYNEVKKNITISYISKFNGRMFRKKTISYTN